MRTQRAPRSVFGGTFSQDGGSDWMTAAEDPDYFWGSLLSEDDLSYWRDELQTDSNPYVRVDERALAQAAFFYTGVGG